MMDFTVSLDSVKTRADLHEVLASALPLPDYYGKNLDALYDVLTEAHEPWVIRFTGCRNARSALGAYFGNFRETFRDAEEEGRRVTSEWDDEER